MAAEDTLVNSLISLLETGQLAVGHPRDVAPWDDGLACEALERFDLEYRRELPADPPALEQPSAMWAARQFLTACQATVHRDLDQSYLEQTLERRWNGPIKAAVHYSVDLTFRFLPDLLRRSRTMSPNDTLVDVLLAPNGFWRKQ